MATRKATLLLALAVLLTACAVAQVWAKPDGKPEDGPPRPEDAPGLKHKLDDPPKPAKPAKAGEDEVYEFKPPGPRGPQMDVEGRSAGFKVYLNQSDNSSFVGVKFGKIQEVGPDGKPVQGHSIPALASLPADLQQGSALVNGTNVTFVQIAIPLNTTGPSFKPCNSSDNRTLNGSIAVTVYITGDANASFPFGNNNTLVVPGHALKFNIEAHDWPFCNSNNSLAVDVFMNTKNDTAPKTKVEEKARPEDGSRPDVRGRKSTRARLAFGGDKVAAFDFPAYATDGVSGNKTFLIDVRPAGESGRTGFTFVFPANREIFYDPVVSQDTTVTASEIGLSSTTTTTPTSSPSPAASTKPKSAASAAAAATTLVACWQPSCARCCSRGGSPTTKTARFQMPLGSSSSS